MPSGWDHTFPSGMTTYSAKAPSRFTPPVRERLAALGALDDSPPATVVVDASGVPEPRAALDGA